MILIWIHHFCHGHLGHGSIFHPSPILPYMFILKFYMRVLGDYWCIFTTHKHKNKSLSITDLEIYIYKLHVIRGRGVEYSWSMSQVSAIDSLYMYKILEYHRLLITFLKTFCSIFVHSYTKKIKLLNVWTCDTYKGDEWTDARTNERLLNRLSPSMTQRGEADVKHSKNKENRIQK
jgi:hypothetical protein